MTKLNRCQAGCTAFLLCAAIANAEPSINLSRKIGPPTSEIAVWGHGFHPHSLVDIYFDTKDEALVVTNNEGEFQHAVIHAPKVAKPGEHWVTALERNNDKGDQEPFVVNTNWSQFLRDDTHTGFNPYENVLNSDNVGTLTVSWKEPNVSDSPSPAVVDGVVYEGNGVGVSAFDEVSGRLLWGFQTEDSVYTAPTVSNGIVYFGNNSSFLYALSANNGQLLWSYAAPGGGISSATVVDGTVYFGCGGSFFALNARTGTLVWQFATGDGFGGVPPPAVANGKAYFGSDDNNLYALDANTGVFLWKYATGGYVQSATIFKGIVYFVSDDDYLYAVDANTGTLIWRFLTQDILFSSPVVADGVVFLGAWDQHVYALNAITGALLWKVGGFATEGAPGLANGVLYVPSGTYPPSLYALDAKNGNTLWVYAVDGNVYTAPIVVNGRVFFNSEFSLYAFGLPDADPVAERSTVQPDLQALIPDLTLQPLFSGEQND